MHNQKILYSHGKKFLIHSLEKIGQFQILSQPIWPNALSNLFLILSVGFRSKAITRPIHSKVCLKTIDIGHYLYGQLSLGNFGHYRT